MSENPGNRLAPYRQLIKSIEVELAHAGRGEAKELHAAVQRTGMLLQSLPRPTPASARPLLLHASALRGRVSIETKRLQESLLISRAALQRSKRVARMYVQRPKNRVDTGA